MIKRSISGRWSSLSTLCIDCESEVSCFYDDSHGGRPVEELMTRSVIVYYFEIESRVYSKQLGYPMVCRSEASR